MTRDMRTVQLCAHREREGRELIDSASWDKDGHHTRGYYEVADRHTDSQAGRQADRQTRRQAGRQAGGEV